MGESRLILAGVLAAGLLAIGCGGELETGQVGKSAQALQSTFQVNLPFPAGHSQSDVALYATSTLTIADGVVLKSAAGVPALAVDVGTGLLTVGAGAHSRSSNLPGICLGRRV